MAVTEIKSVPGGHRSRSWHAEFDEGRHWKGNIGFVLLPNEATVEDDLYRMAPPGVGLHFTRGEMPIEITVSALAAMKDSLSVAAEKLLPARRLDVISYACTSGSIVVGEEEVFTELRRGAPEAKPTSMVSGVIAALWALEAQKIVICTPYLDEINDLEATYLTERGFDVLDIQGLNLDLDEDMNRVTPGFLVDFARAVDRPEAEAIFISCGALRTIEVIEELEQLSGKPVVCSNQAMFWHCLRLAGIDDKIEGYGRLFRDY